LIFLSNVAKYFDGKPLLQGVNISVHRGDRVGIVGPNGAGKSTILGMMAGTTTPDEGEVSVEKRVRMGVLRQEQIEGLDRPILEEIMDVAGRMSEIRERLHALELKMESLSEAGGQAEAVLEEHGTLQLEFERYGGYSLESRALKVLHGLGFRPEDVSRPWKEFSGGWRMRVSLAKILLAEPDALLLDEPTNHLDLERLLWVENYLSGFKGALVLVSHDRAFLNRLVKKIVEVDRGKATSYTGDYDQFEKTREMQEQVLLASYKSQEEKRKHIQKFIDRNRVKARTASRVQSRIKMLEKMEKVEPPRTRRDLKFTFPEPPSAGRRVLEIEGLVKRYDRNTVYDGLDLAVERGERIGLVGPNGAGKSTLMKIVAGIIEYDGGTMKYGHNVKPGYFAQHQWENLSPENTVLLEASLPAAGMKESELRSILGAFLFSGDDVFKKVKVLSGGEKSRLALVKILVAPPNLLLMDEPTNHLDIPACRVLEQALKSFQGTVLLITHDRRLMNEICSGILEIRDGRGEYYLGNYEDYEYKKRLEEAESAEPEEAEPPEVVEEESERPSKLARKERKRREAETRRALAKRRTPIVREIEQVEEELRNKESRRTEIRTIMSDPKNYENRDLILPLIAEEPTLTKEIKELEARWEELQMRLEEIDKETSAG
jgi:ATP-binding cassette subfamily F protein 3